MDRFRDDPKDEEFVDYCGCGCGREIYRGDEIWKPKEDACRMFATEECYLEFTGGEKVIVE